MKLKFENINMKKVLIIGGIVLLLVTLLFIAYTTGIFNKKANDNPSDDEIANACVTVSEEAKNRTKPEDELNAIERRYIIVENFEEWLAEQLEDEEFADKVETVAFRVSDFLRYTDDVDLTLSTGSIRVKFNNNGYETVTAGIETQNGPNSGCPTDPKQDPNPDQNPDWLGGINPNSISQGARNRTKREADLSSEERVFLLLENKNEFLEKNYKWYCPEIKEGEPCVLTIATAASYTSDLNLGLFILQCEGEIIANWNKNRERFVFDASKLRCR